MLEDAYTGQALEFTQVSTPETKAAQVDRLLSIVNGAGVELPTGVDATSVGFEADKLAADVAQMQPEAAMSFIDAKIAELQPSAVESLAGGFADFASNAAGLENRALTGKEKERIILGLAILATILVLAYLNPAWAAKAVLALISVLGGYLTMKGAQKAQLMAGLTAAVAQK